jgi:nucleoid-associated protein YgaU
MSNIDPRTQVETLDPDGYDSAEANVEVAGKLPTSYTVQPGDTLTSIARVLYGHESNWRRLMEVNAHVDGFDGFPTSLERPGVVLTTNLDV